MGEIVPFPAARRPRAAASPPEGPVEILFFLGVRYVRHEDAVGGPKNDKSNGDKSNGAAPRRARRRKRA